MSVQLGSVKVAETILVGYGRCVTSGGWVAAREFVCKKTSTAVAYTIVAKCLAASDNWSLADLNPKLGWGEADYVPDEAAVWIVRPMLFLYANKFA